MRCNACPCTTKTQFCGTEARLEGLCDIQRVVLVYRSQQMIYYCIDTAYM